MLTIPATYYNNNEDYITLTAIRSFMRNHPEGKFKVSLPREELLDSIIDFGNQNDSNSETVLNWIDAVLQEGIKDIYLQYAPISEEMQLQFTSKSGIENYLDAYRNKTLNHHVCMNTYGQQYILVSALYIENSKRITFVYCRKLHVHDKKNRTTKGIDYPVIADYFLDSAWLLIRAKPRSNLYIFNPNGFDIEEAESTTTEKEILLVSSLVGKILQVQKELKSYISAQLKNKIFNLLHTYSNTPTEIAKVMEEKKSEIQDIANSIQTLCTVPSNCNISQSMAKDIKEDISNIIEKYLSINWKDKNIFIKDRMAYPVKLSATDEEESKVEQSAALEEPLQTKALFFDNKKMLYKSKRCDGVVFQWRRRNPENFLRDSFAVRIFVNQKGHCVFKFSEYTAKEDIENVVFSIIND